ncbi:MAG: alpha/beta fold hydrolase [Opitutaceae bacterium]|jgi:pimeloyl-ACP methyl ester carboxylesterase|nr:alpha/beta fold hydrolase [Opitutaceae bacterium]
MDLFFRDFGGAGKPPLVVLHGLLGSSRNWRTAGGDLAASHHVLAPDLRNHGRSPRADGMGYDAMVGDVLGWLDARGLRRVSLLGHSMGGKVAMALACCHAERVSRLVVVDIAPRDYPPAHQAEFAAMNALDLRSLRSRAEAEARFEARVGDWAMRKFLATNLERVPETAPENEPRTRGGGACAGGAGIACAVPSVARWRWAVNLPVLTAALPELGRNPLREGERFDGEVLLLAGAKSDYVGPGDWAAVTGHFPRARLEVVAGAGHNPHIERRAEFARLAGGFLAGA